WVIQFRSFKQTASVSRLFCYNACRRFYKLIEKGILNMKAMIVKEDKLVTSKAEKPTPKKGEILIKVKAAAVNRTDILNRKRKKKEIKIKEKKLVTTKTEKPTQKKGEILIKVKAAAVNRTDILNRKRKTSYMDLPILGVEVAGIVEDAGDTDLAKGTPVMGLV